MGLLKQSDIPGNITHDVVSSVIDDLYDECPGRIGCLHGDDGCDSGGKHFSRNEKIAIVVSGVIWVPLLIVTDVINVGIFPFKFGWRVYEKCY